MLNIKSAAITGATGMLGQHLIRKLLQEDITVTAYIHTGSKKRDSLPEDTRLTIVECNLDELKHVDPGTKTCDVFYHFAWGGTYGAARNDYSLQLANAEYTLDAVRLAKRLGCTVFIGAGSQAEYGRCEDMLTPQTSTKPENGYGIGKLTAGMMSRALCKELGMTHIWTRVLSVYGPYDNAYTMVMSGIYKLLAGERPVYTKGEQQWDYLYAEDAAEAFLALARSGRDGGVYPLGSGMVKPLAEYIQMIRDAAAPEAEIGIGEVPYQPGQVMHLQADISDLTKDTGFIPRTPFKEGIQRTVEWCRKGM